jgi:hypothetical protein
VHPFVLSAMGVSPQQRPTAHEALQKPWMEVSLPESLGADTQAGLDAGAQSVVASNQNSNVIAHTASERLSTVASKAWTDATTVAGPSAKTVANEWAGAIQALSDSLQDSFKYFSPLLYILEIMNTSNIVVARVSRRTTRPSEVRARRVLESSIPGFTTPRCKKNMHGHNPSLWRDGGDRVLKSSKILTTRHLSTPSPSNRISRHQNGRRFENRYKIEDRQRIQNFLKTEGGP